MLKVKKSQLAENDLVQILRYLDELNPSLASRFSDQFDRTLDLLARQPKLGKSRDDYRQGLRSIIVDRYVLFFHTDSRGLEVVRVIHGSRNIEKVFHETEVD